MSNSRWSQGAGAESAASADVRVPVVALPMLSDGVDLGGLYTLAHDLAAGGFA